jgi:hypothetical protein
VNEPTNATLAASDGELFLRTDKSLWCISAAGGAAAGPRAAAPVQPAPAR